VVGLESFVLEEGLFGRDELQSLQAAALARVDAAIEFAESSPMPAIWRLGRKISP